MSVKHSVTASGVDSGNGLISKNAWNADHVVTQHGAKLYLNTSYTAADTQALDCDQVEYDTDGFSSVGKATGSMSLTGTVSATSGSTTITGSGTLFTTQLSVGTIVLGYGFVGTVRSIASNTSLELWQAAFMNSSGAAIQRRAGFTIPAGLGGKYLVMGYADWDWRAFGSSVNTGGVRQMNVATYMWAPTAQYDTKAFSIVNAINGWDTTINLSYVGNFNPYDIVFLPVGASDYTNGYPYLFAGSFLSINRL